LSLRGKRAARCQAIPSAPAAGLANLRSAARRQQRKTPPAGELPHMARARAAL